MPAPEKAGISLNGHFLFKGRERGNVPLPTLDAFLQEDPRFSQGYVFLLQMPAFCPAAPSLSSESAAAFEKEHIPMPYSVPIVIENTGRVERSYDIYSRLLKDRIVLLGTEVDDTIASLVCAQLLFLESQDPEKEIYLYINSPGGSVTAGLAIYDTMRYITAPVATLCMGMAASMGAFLLAAGTKGMRYCLPHSTVMIHQPLGGFRGQATDVEIHAREMQRIKTMLNTIMAENTGRTIREVTKACERDNFLTPQEAIDFGLVDKILSSRKDIAPAAE